MSNPEETPRPRPRSEPGGEPVEARTDPGSNNTTIFHTPPLPLAGQKYVSPLTALGHSDSGGPRVQADAAPGERVGDYILLDELARGGMGVVYKARHGKLDRIVALKMIRSIDLAQRGDIERFHVEAKAAAQLEHPNIVPIYDVGDHAGRPYYTMRLIEGGNLATHLGELRGNGRAIARLMEPVARAVHHAHQHGILHRDLKPANILLANRGAGPGDVRGPGSSLGGLVTPAPGPTPLQAIAAPAAPVEPTAPASSVSPGDWTPFVTDFGLAKRFEADSQMTQSGAVMGTPAYISPEQASGARGRVSTASDVYALGAILYEMLTGKPPFQGSTVGDILLQVMESEPIRPRVIDPAIDRDLETICLKCLEKEPARRYPSASDLADDLQRWLGHKPIEARPATAWERLGKLTRRRPATVALITVTTLGFIIVSLLYRQAVKQTRLARAEATRANQQALIAEEQAQIARKEAQSRAEAEQVAQVGLEALGSLASTTGQTREVIQQLWSTGNLRTIGQALAVYNKHNGTFPPAAILDPRTNRPLLSWRVAILPYLGMGELYKRFHVNEPWDSPNNLALIDEMPSVYRVLPFTRPSPMVTQLLNASQAIDPTRIGLISRMPGVLNALGPSVASQQPVTYYRAVVGPDTLFDGPTGRPPGDAEDGPEQTMLVVEAGPPVIWTRPEELDIAALNGPKRIAGPSPELGLLSLMADGTVRTLRSDIPPQILKRLGTRWGDALPAR